ncbi:hypothetical protein N9R43_01210 [bacterium]|nr:hypothetical protein [bacterium]
MKNPLDFRKQFEPKIIELTKAADKASRAYTVDKDKSALAQYRYYVMEIIKLKDYIVAHEKKEDKE